MQALRLLLPLLLLSELASAEPAIQSLPSIENAVLNYVSSSQQASDDAEFTLGRLDPRLRLPLCDEALSTRNTHTQRSSGPLSVEVRCNGSKPWALYVPVTVERFAEVVVTTRTLSRGDTIAAEDLESSRRRIDRRHENYLTDTAIAVGQIALRRVGSGEILTHNQFKQPQLVRRGDHVMLSMGNQTITVRVKGEALENGTAGERISVLNLSSERVIEGVVTAAGEVVVQRGAML